MKRIFSDNEGNASSMRLMAVGALLVASVLAVFPMLGWGENDVDNNLILYFLLAAFGGKVGQKFAETNEQPPG